MSVATMVLPLVASYPTGNTAAVNFLQCLPAPKQPSPGKKRKNATKDVDDPAAYANVLVLGCGGPRNILYSLYCEGESGRRSCDFTLCDTSPAIIARNTLLFTLIQRVKSSKDKDNTPLVWQIFYEFFIINESIVLLQVHALDLYNASTDMESWHASEYGKDILFMSARTLQETRRFWKFYADSKTWTPKENEDYEGSLHTYMEEVSELGGVESGARAAASLYSPAQFVFGRAWEKCWKDGIAGGQACQTPSSKNKPFANPMFAAHANSCKQKIFMHPSTEPLHGFHMADAFTQVETKFQLGEINNDAAIDDMVRLLVTSAKKQFAAWCEAYFQKQKLGLVKLRMHIGDTVEFCETLGNISNVLDDEVGEGALDEGLATKFESMNLQVSAKGLRLFDVIETSNLADHLGMLNLAILSTTLLANKSTSRLFMESMEFPVCGASCSLQDQLYTDITSFSVLIGIAPLDYLTGYSTTSWQVDADVQAKSIEPGSTNHRPLTIIRIAWGFPELDGQELFRSLNPELFLDFKQDEIVRWLSNLYNNMFPSQAIEIPTSDPGFRHELRQYCIPATFAKVIRVIKERIAIEFDWDGMMEDLIKHIRDDKERLDTQGDLLLQLFMHDVWTTSFFNGPPKQLKSLFGMEARGLDENTGYLSQEDLPLTSTIAIRVPRETLKALKELAGYQPCLSGAIHYGARSPNPEKGWSTQVFACTQYFFGKIEEHDWDKAKGLHSGIFSAVEDTLDWENNENLVVMYEVPTAMLLIGDLAALKVGLCISSHLRYNSTYRPGERSNVFWAPLSSSYVTTMANGPTFDNMELCNFCPTDPIVKDTSRTHLSIRLHLDKEKVSFLQQVVKFSASDADGKELQSGAQVTISQNGPYDVKLQIGTTERLVRFPYPVVARQHAVRVARKSLWVEIKIPPANGLTPDGYDLNPFPISVHVKPGGVPNFVPWTVPRINDLARLPDIKIQKPAKRMWWVGQHALLVFHKNELEISQVAFGDPRRTMGNPRLTARMTFKESIVMLFRFFTGATPEREVFDTCMFLPGDGTGHVDTIVFCHRMCHDHTAHSLIMDAFVVTITKDIGVKLGKTISALTQCGYGSGQDELSTKLWKHYLPACVERSRTWKHKQSCEYLQAESVPLKCETRFDDPLCRCGQGIGVEPMLMKKIWQPFAPYATRLTISPIFPVPFLELPEGTTDLASLVAKARK